MTDVRERVLKAFETHDLAGLQALIDGGFDPNTPFDGKPAIDLLVEMYFRSDAFPDCLRLMMEHGGAIADPPLAPVLLDDEALLEKNLAEHPHYLGHRARLPSAFTSLDDVSLLHIAAEYGSLRAATWLIDKGCDVNVRAETDRWGLNGHTPIFHSVNSNANRSAPIMRLLLAHGARTDIRVDGLWWGKGFEWETVLFDLTPISFALMGLLPQFHRAEADVYGNVGEMLKASGRPMPPTVNVPNRYLT